MKITIFGSCRQDSLYNEYEITKIKNDVSYPHYTKEVIEIINFIKYDTIQPEDTINIFRTPIMNQTPIYSNNYKNDFDTTDVFIIEISTKLCYEYNNKYVHHIIYDMDKYINNEVKNNILKRIQTDEEIENDIVKIKKELEHSKILFVGHIVTYEKGERYNLIKLLEQICAKHNILFINPVKEFNKRGYDINNMIHQEDKIMHYNNTGHNVIKTIYKEYINYLLSDLNYLIVYNSNLNKVRIGLNSDDSVESNNVDDGGYVILDGLDYNLLLSCGISNDIRFENKFLDKYNNIKCYAFDGTIDSLPDENFNKNINFIKKNITNTNTIDTTNLLDIIDNNDNIFLKMDIETNEFQWLEILNTDQLLKFKQIVIEFHFVFQESNFVDDLFTNLSFPISVERRINCLKKLANTHYLLHFHPNNCCGTIFYNGVEIPNVFECTYVRKDLCNDITISNKEIPDKVLDIKNTNNTDIYLSGFPFSF
uniref:Methyltransferase FkbM domain-containing protein n=1 Tax=viral metagenome TaxID=1070528 RepID=A0A6C0BU31_9ZZZZ